jgi:hypothetical protein
MKYDEQSAAWAAMHMIYGTPPREIARALGGTVIGLRSLFSRFCGIEDKWLFHDPRGIEAMKMLKPALAVYCEKAGIAPGDRIGPGRPLVPPRFSKPKPAKPPPAPDTSEYGVAKAEYLEALARLKAAKNRAVAGLVAGPGGPALPGPGAANG